jgi:hypothetical protein
MSARLSKKQKAYLSQLARRAFNLACDRARERGEEPDSSCRAADDWRRRQTAVACRKFGLRCCSQDDYRLVEARFLHIIGEDGLALNSLLVQQAEPRSTAEAHLYFELEKARDVGITREYLGTICRSQFKCSLLEASENMFLCLLYTLRNRVAARRRKLKAEDRERRTEDREVAA